MVRFKCGKTDWRLRLNVERLGTSNFAQNVNLAISFPFAAFHTEMLPGSPNLMMGLQTRLPGIAGQPSYTTGLDGGILPVTMEMVMPRTSWRAPPTPSGGTSSPREPPTRLPTSPESLTETTRPRRLTAWAGPPTFKTCRPTSCPIPASF